MLLEGRCGDELFEKADIIYEGMFPWFGNEMFNYERLLLYVYMLPCHYVS